MSSERRRCRLCSVQSADNGQHDRNPGQSSRVGRLACTRHVIGLTLTKALLLALAAAVLELPLSVAGVTVGLGLDAASHWWADRRSSLAWLAKVTGKSEFYRLGTGDHSAHPVTVERKPAAHLGTGAYALDLLCTNKGGAECRRLVLCEPEPSEGALVCKPLVGLMIGNECCQSSPQLWFEAAASVRERPQVIGATQQGQELEDLAAVVTRDVQEVGGGRDRATDQVLAGELLQDTVDSFVGAVSLLHLERRDQGVNCCGASVPSTMSARAT